MLPPRYHAVSNGAMLGPAITSPKYAHPACPSSQVPAQPRACHHIADSLRYAHMRCGDSVDHEITQFEIRKAWRESAEAAPDAHELLTQVAKLTWEDVLEPHIVALPDLPKDHGK